MWADEPELPDDPEDPGDDDDGESWGKRLAFALIVSISTAVAEKVAEGVVTEIRERFFRKEEREEDAQKKGDEDQS